MTRLLLQLPHLRVLLLLAGSLLARPALAGPDNLAPLAQPTASSSRGPAQAAAQATDGIIGVAGRGEWACAGDTTDWGYIRFPWLQLTWAQPVTVGRVVLYDRPAPGVHTAGGRLLFSDGSTVWVNQLPNDGTARAVSFAPRQVSWVKFEVTDGRGRDLGLSEIEVFAPAGQGRDYVAQVDPYIETDRGRYFFFVPGQRPFGLVGAAPVTRNKNQNGGGYNYNDTEILGFSQVHAWMQTGLELMPTTQAVDPTRGEQGWKSTFSHDDELVQPGYQRVYLRTPRAWVELTATERVSCYRITYTHDTEAQLLANLGGYLGNATMAHADAQRQGDRELAGSFSTVGRYWGGPQDVKVYFVLQADQPFAGVDSWAGTTRTANAAGVRGEQAGLAARYHARAGTPLLVKIGLSYVSVANARQNLQAECPGWDFEQVRRQSRAVWNEWLGRIDVQGGSAEQRVKFYTDLWHVLLGRHKLNDVNGQYPDRTQGRRVGMFTEATPRIRTLPKNRQGQLRFNMYSSDAWWLSQWNLNVLWGLAWPEVQDEMSASMLQYAANGYKLPRGPSGGGYSYIMTSCPATNLIASTFQKGLLTKFDPKEAYRLVRQNHLPGGMLGDSASIDFYTAHGYWPGNAGITVEAAFQDYALAQMARKLGHPADYAFFSRRAKGWQTLYNPAYKLLFPKGPTGEFLHQNPLSGAGWVEANAWQGSWGVSHDIPGLAALMGGPDTLAAKLNYAFEQAAPSDFVFDYSGGYLSYANQPGCSNAHVFSYAGQPWLTQYWVRRVQAQAYGGTTPDLGYGGHDEDQGQMGGVSALMALGLFDLQGNVAATPVYNLTSPVFSQATIKLDGRYYPGRQFVIKAHDASPQNCYIQRAQLNGEPLNTFWFRHADFAKGGVLELWLGPAPNRQWGTAGLPPTTP